MADIRSSLFGRLVLDTKLATSEQIKECLDLQAEYEKAGKSVPRLGELLAVKGYLTADQVRELLRKQKAEATVEKPPLPDPVAAVTSINSSKIIAESEPEQVFDAETSQRRGGEVFGNFKIIKRLGKDSAGYTYRAKFIPKDLTVILRVLSKEKLEESPEYADEFQEQVRKATALKHPSIQRMVAAGRKFGRDYYAAQFVEGISLKRILEARGHLDVPFAIDIGIQLAKALEYGHARGLYHQEIRPSNILITGERNAMLVAYGVAHDVIGNLEKLAESAGETPFYIAPEQAVREESGRKPSCDARTDIYCLGTVLYHAITGQPPFKGESAQEVLLSLAEEDVADPTLLNPDIPRRFSDIVLSMMNPEPDNRYQSATHLLQDLQAAQEEINAAPAASTVASDVMIAPVARAPQTTQGLAKRPETGRGKPISSHLAHGVAGGHVRGAGGDSQDRKPRRKAGREDSSPAIMIGGVVVLVLAIVGIMYAATREAPPMPKADNTPEYRDEFGSVISKAEYEAAQAERKRKKEEAAKKKGDKSSDRKKVTEEVKKAANTENRTPQPDTPKVEPEKEVKDLSQPDEDLGDPADRPKRGLGLLN